MQFISIPVDTRITCMVTDKQPGATTISLRSISVEPVGLWGTTLLPIWACCKEAAMFKMYKPHTRSIQRRRRPTQSTQFSEGRLSVTHWLFDQMRNAMSLPFCFRVTALNIWTGNVSIEVTVKLTSDLFCIKCLTFYPIRHLYEALSQCVNAGFMAINVGDSVKCVQFPWRCWN